MNVTGKVIAIGAAQQVSDKLTKRELIVQYAENPTYPETIKFEAINDKCALLDSVKVGDEVDVHFNLKGRAWVNPKGETQYFNTLQLWKVSLIGGNYAAPVENNAGAGDDLPF